MTKRPKVRLPALPFLALASVLLAALTFIPSLWQVQVPRNFAWLELAKTTKQTTGPVLISPALQINAGPLAPCFRPGNTAFQDRSMRQCQGLALWLSGPADKAVDFWEGIAGSTHLSSPELYYLAWGLAAKGRLEEADRAWQQTEASSSFFQALYVWERQRSGSSELSMHLAELAARTKPDDAQNWLRVAAEYGDHGRIEESVAAWNKAASLLHPDQARYWWALGRAHYVRSEWEQAATNFAKGLEIDPGDREMWRHLYHAYLSAGDYAGAAGAAVRWAQALPADTEAYVSAGRAFYLGGDDRSAQDWEEQALAVDPSSAEAYRWLAAVAVQQGDRAAAAQHLHQAVDLDPKYAEAYFDLAQLARDQGDLNQAYRLAEQAIGLYPWGCPAEWHAKLGDWARAAGDSQRAASAYSEALKCDSNLANVRQALEALQAEQ